MRDTAKNRAHVKTADGLERYVFGPDIVLESQSWVGAEQKIGDLLGRLREHYNQAVSYYDEGGKVLWEEYQLLFMCQFLEFKLAELMTYLHGFGAVKEEFFHRLQKNRRANRERAKQPRRLISPAALLVDFGYSLGGLMKIVDEETLSFDGKDELLRELRTFNDGRVGFIHHSFNGEKQSGNSTTGELITETLQCGNRVLSMLEKLPADFREKRSSGKTDADL